MGDGSDVIVCLFGEAGYDRAAQGVAGAGKKLADGLGCKLRALILGPAEEGLLSALAGIAYAVIHADQPELTEYQPETCLSAIVQVCSQCSPMVILLSNDVYSQEMTPRLAHRLGGSSLSDVTAVALSGDALRMTRPAYGGKAVAVYEPRRLPVVVSLRARSFEQASPGTQEAAVVKAELTLPKENLARIIERHEEVSEGPDLEDAPIVVAGGRGLGGPEGFQQLQKLAVILGAAIGSSRGACDEGWAPPSCQIGQTGKKVAPELYIAVGISGAAQHLLGISDSREIVAINTDPEAPIFKHCTFGIVEDYKKAVPILIKKLAEPGNESR